MAAVLEKSCAYVASSVSPGSLARYKVLLLRTVQLNLRVVVLNPGCPCFLFKTASE